MAGMDWFRWHHGSVTDPKFQLVARKAGASLPDVLAVWAYVLETASQANERGTFGELDAEALDCLFGFPADQTRTADILRAMTERGLIAAGVVTSWQKRQPKREREDTTSTERKRKQRDTADDGPSGGVTPCHAMSRQEKPRGEESREEEKREDKPPTFPPPSIAAEYALDSTAAPTIAGTVCKAIKAKGVPDVNPSHPALRAFIERGVPVATFEAAAEVCARASPPKGMQYLLGIVKRQFDEAADIAKRPRLQAGPWDATRSSILAKAAELGIEPWNENDLSVDRETFAAYEARVRRLVEAEVPA